MLYHPCLPSVKAAALESSQLVGAELGLLSVPRLGLRRSELQRFETRTLWAFKGFGTFLVYLRVSGEQTSMKTLNASRCYAAKIDSVAHAFSARDALCFLFPPLPCFLEFSSFNSAGSMFFSNAVIVCSFLPVSCLFPCSLYW